MEIYNKGDKVKFKLGSYDFAGTVVKKIRNDLVAVWVYDHHKNFGRSLRWDIGVGFKEQYGDTLAKVDDRFFPVKTDRITSEEEC